MLNVIAVRTLLLSGDMSGEVVLARISVSAQPGADYSTVHETQPIACFGDHTKYAVRVRWAPDGRQFASASYDKSVCLYGCVRGRSDLDTSSIADYRFAILVQLRRLR